MIDAFYDRVELDEGIVERDSLDDEVTFGYERRAA